jgi:glycosyltransferase involved in cell wall biosynthesis
VRILYLADIRFPLERANGIQSMQTCHALVSRKHDVTLLVRPDSHTPPRDPFAFYGLRPLDAEHTAAEHAEYADQKAAEHAEYADQKAAEYAGHADQEAAECAEHADQKAAEYAEHADQEAAEHAEHADRKTADRGEHAGKGALRIEVVPVAGPASYRRAGYLTFAIGRAMGRARQDLIFTRDLGLASLLLRIPASLRAPLVYEAHGIAGDVAAALPELLTGASEASPAKLRRLARRDAHVWKAADGYVTITDGLKRELERRFASRSRIAVVPDGASAANDPILQPSAFAEASADQPTSDLRPPMFTIGYAGHLYPWKGVDLIIEAVAALKDTRGLIIGGHEQEPDLARVKALAEQLQCASRVTFTGLIPPAAVAARLRQADVLALPNPASSLSSTFTSPLKLFEYMASGRPIVASDLASLREVLRDGENALLVEPGNPQALTAGIHRIKDDAALGRRLAEQARQDVRQFTWARRAERLEVLFSEVLGVRGVSASAVKGRRRERLP